MAVKRLGFTLTAQQVAKATGKKPKKVKQPLPPSQAPSERDYRRQLRALVAETVTIVRQELEAEIPSMVAERNADRPQGLKTDDWGDRLLGVMLRVRTRVAAQWTAEEIARIIGRVGSETTRRNLVGLEGQWKKVVGVDLFLSEPYLTGELRAWAIQNTQLISSIPDQFLGRVETTVSSALSAGRRAEDVSAELQATYELPKARADLIARDQVAKLNGNLTMLRQNQIGIEEYTWRTVGDERVRESHREKDGQIFRWDDPPADTGHPGDDFQCRCYAEPVFPTGEE